jgi:hypothetical protein
MFLVTTLLISAVDAMQLCQVIAGTPFSLIRNGESARLTTKA